MYNPLEINKHDERTLLQKLLYGDKYRGWVIGLGGCARRFCIRHVSVSSFKDKGEYPSNGFVKIQSKGFPPCGMRLWTKHWMFEYWYTMK